MRRREKAHTIRVSFLPQAVDQTIDDLPGLSHIRRGTWLAGHCKIPYPISEGGAVHDGQHENRYRIRETAAEAVATRPSNT